MDVTPGRVTRCAVGPRALLVGLVLLGGLAAPCDAAPIKARRLPARAQTAANPWDAYFRRALNTRSLRVRVPAAMRPLRLQADGTLPETSFVQYLRWRRSLSPRRFDSFHPNLSSMLIRDQAVRPSVIPPIPPVVTPPTTTNPRPQPLLPPQVPEPSSVLVLAALFAAAAWARRGRRAGRAEMGGVA
jgi:hypothetical protein